MSRVPVTIACPECEHDALEHSERDLLASKFAPTCSRAGTVAPGQGSGAVYSNPCECTLSRTDILLNEIVAARLERNTALHELSRVKTELETAKRDADAKTDTLAREIAAGRRAYLSLDAERKALAARISDALS